MKPLHCVFGGPVPLLGCLLWLAPCVHAAAAAATESAAPIEEVVVRGDSIQTRLGQMGSASVLLAEEVRQIGATHINETLARIPGVWISRGSGQEHLAAIRSPVYTGAGACGEFSYLENGVPIRPTGFCNINNLFELNTEQAEAIEVWRGPAAAVLGGNALHGAINVVTPLPQGMGVSVEGGAYDFYRGQVWAGGERGAHQLGFSFVQTSSNGYRDDTGYGQQKLHLAHRGEIGGWQVRNTFTATLLNQETGGFVGGFEAYDDGDLRDTNPNPEAFRDAWSLRYGADLQRDMWTLKPYLRRSAMRFLQHFLPGQPLEENDQTSAGIIGLRALEFAAGEAEAGLQFEYMAGALREFQALPTTGSAFLVATRPPGLHYDYDVDSWLAAGFYNLTLSVADDTRLVHSLRIEHLAYDYDNHHLVGNTRDDGTPCSFSGCLYTRPADREDDFTNLGARVGLEQTLGSGLILYATVNQGFRAPQATELYRLRGGQTVADLDSEILRGIELGMRKANWHVALYADKTTDLLLRDADAFNISDGKTESVGVEFAGNWQWGAHGLSVSASWARHKYAFDRLAEGREVIEDGNDVDTAPRWLGNAVWHTQWGRGWRQELEFTFVGEHFLDAANTAEYDGHVVLNWRLQWQASERLQVFSRVMNVMDERYADRADFAFGGYRYFPAMPRQVYAGLQYAW